MSKNGFENAKGVFPWQPGDEPSEITIRRLRGGNIPQWIFVEQWEPKPLDEVKITDGINICRGYVTKRNTWITIGAHSCDPIAWLYEPFNMPEPPTIEEHEKWLEWSGHKAQP